MTRPELDLTQQEPIPPAGVQAALALIEHRFIGPRQVREPAGFTSVRTHGRHFGQPQALPNAERVLGGLCDLRLPLTLSQADCAAIAAALRAALAD